MGRRGEFRYDEHLKEHYLEQVLDTPKFKAFYLKRKGHGRMESCLFFFSPEGISIHGDLCPGSDGRNSGVHAYGYGLDWFAGNLSWSYLCEKFLSKEWHRELAEEDCRRIAEEILAGDTSYFDRDRQLEEVEGERETLASDLRDLLDDRRRGLAERGDVKAAADVIRARGRVLRVSIMERRRLHAEKYIDLASQLDDGEMGVDSFGRAMYEIDGDFVEYSPGYGYHPRSRHLLVALQKKFSELYAKLDPAPLALGGEA